MAIVTTVLDMGGPMSTVNERKVDRGLGRLEGGDSTSSCRAAPYPLDVTTGEVAPNQPVQGQQPPPGQGGTTHHPTSSRCATACYAAYGATSRLWESYQRVSVCGRLRRTSRHGSRVLESSEAHVRHCETSSKGSAPESWLASPRCRGGRRHARGFGLVGSGRRGTVTGGCAQPVVDNGAGLVWPRLSRWRTSCRRPGGVGAWRANWPTASRRSTELPSGHRRSGTTEGLRRGYSSAQIAAGVPDETYDGVDGYSRICRLSQRHDCQDRNVHGLQLANIGHVPLSGVVNQVEIADGTAFDSMCAGNGEIMSVDELEDRQHPNRTHWRLFRLSVNEPRGQHLLTPTQETAG